ncbi:MAG: ribonucleotide reductase subunit alpha [Gammaproteobacteria bacterium]
MNIASFADLLSASRAQPVPQSLLMVFVDVELPPDSTPEQREQFARGQGGALTPRMCVDRSPADIESWEALVRDADAQSEQWRMVMVAALAGKSGQAPASDQIDRALNQMVMSIHQGQIQAFVPFDRQGQAVHFG